MAVHISGRTGIHERGQIMKIVFKHRLVSSFVLSLLCSTAALWAAETAGLQIRHGGGVPGGGVSAAQSRELKGRERASAASGALQAFLGLTDAQMASITQEGRTLEQTLRALDARLNQSRAQTEQSMQSGDPTAIGKSVLEGIAISKQIRAERGAYRDRIQAILNAQQAEKLNQALEVLQFARENPYFLGPLGTGGEEEEQIRHSAERMEIRRHAAPVN
jgi:hypothetical protein